MLAWVGTCWDVMVLACGSIGLGRRDVRVSAGGGRRGQMEFLTSKWGGCAGSFLRRV